jgi:methylated-DNA-[protein]-cysteine S-methyltransferase
MNKYKFNVGTKFQKMVWNSIATIPEGKVMTYQELAMKIGHPKSFRAVASACGKNPYVPEIPCHRVVRKDGELGGYSAEGGIKRKKYMLEKEGHKFNKDKIILKICR